MKKLFYFYLMIFSFFSYGQTNPTIASVTETPDGLMDNVFDQYGNKYNLADLKVEPVKYMKNTNVAITTTGPVSAGYFNLYFETGCGMENYASNTTHAARKNVLVQVYNDLSNFIISPLSNPGNTAKVNIWVRNINSVIAPDSPNGVLGLASPFYNMPYKNTSGFGGIVDNEIWKTIHAGKDSYTNVTSPLISTGVSSGVSGLYYHGIVAINFNDTATPAIPNSPVITWNTSASPATGGNYDLYSVILHEVVHSLGFASLINGNGLSKLGIGFNYYTRYDLYLKNNANTAFLLTSSGTCSMYNYSFNNSLNSSILQPSATLPYCTNTIRYVGTSNVQVYTPSIFEPTSSLSHFEDGCYINTSTGVAYGSGAYFTMSKSIGFNVTKRYLKPEERNVLTDIGYSVKNVFGSSAFSNVYTYSGSTSPSTGIKVAGINDGIKTDGTYLYIGVATPASPIVINSATDTTRQILANDVESSTTNGIPTTFECLQDVFDSTATITSTSGNLTTPVSFTSTISGLHLLRYIPVNSLGQKGNITYIYVYVKPNNSCGTPSSCDLIINGNFEQFNQAPAGNGLNNLQNACNWSKANSGTPDYFNSGYYSQTTVPCNFIGYETDRISGNKAYAGMLIGTDMYNNLVSEPIKTDLGSPLISNSNYQLSFDLSLAEGYTIRASKIQAYFSNSSTIYPTGNGIAVSNPSILLTDNKYNTKTNGWEKVVFNFSTGSSSGESTLYIGGLANTPIINTIQGPMGLNNCNYLNYGTSGLGDFGYYYIDNVSLIPLNGGSFTLPATICSNQTLSNLKSYLSGLPLTGVFSGPGVSLSGGIYKFNAAIVPLGVNTISYTYTNSSNCSVTIYCNITVIQAPSVPVITGNNNSCITVGNSNIYSTTLGSGETALWTITSGAGTITNGNTANASISWSSLPATLKVTITNANGCTSSTTMNVGILQAYITGTSTACTSQTANNTKTYSTTLATNQNALWQIIPSTAGTFMSGTTSASTTPIIKWTSLPATLKLTITQTGGCSVTKTLNITSLCSASCSCLDDLTTIYYTQIADTGGTSISVEQTTMSDLCDGFVTFNFDFGDGTTSGPSGNYVEHCYPSNATYNVVCTATMANGCSRTISFPVTGFPCTTPPCISCPVSGKQTINQLNNSPANYQIEIKPNPTNDLLNIRINNYVGKVNIQVIDINGRIVSEYKNEEFNIEKSLNLNNLQTGMYVLKVSGDSLNFTQKIMKN